MDVYEALYTTRAMRYPPGRWRVAPRTPVHGVSFRNHWGQPVSFQIEAPLWPAER